jgi:hypothetical protein
MLRIIAPQLWR